MSDKVTISGFSKSEINGVYSYWKEVNGYDAFKKDSTHIIFYRPALWGYTGTPSYFIMENKQIDGGIAQWVPVARSEGANIAAPIWITMNDVTSNEQTVGSTVYDNDSSSSSSSSSIDSSSSSSSSNGSSSSSSSN